LLGWSGFYRHGFHGPNSMASLAERAELVGFFSYSRDDDEDSHGALSALRESIQRELRGQLGRTMKTFRLWQDKEAISPGKLWEEEIKAGVGQAVFFIPIITPTVVRSSNCRFELDSFLAREAELGRSDLVFPILYIRVPELEDSALRNSSPVLSIIARRQYLDWRELRHRDIYSTDVKEAVEKFCRKICDTLGHPWLSPEDRRAQEEALALQRREAEIKTQEAEAKRREEQGRQQAALEAQQRADEDRRNREAQRQKIEQQQRRPEPEPESKPQPEPQPQPQSRQGWRSWANPKVIAATAAAVLFIGFLVFYQSGTTTAPYTSNSTTPDTTSSSADTTSSSAPQEPVASLGADLGEVTSDVADRLGIDPPRGALVLSVDDAGPAQEAGLQPDDVIVKFQGQDIDQYSDLPGLVAAASVGSSVQLDVIRNSRHTSVTLTIGQQ